MQLTRCAECKMEFSHRNLRENLRFNRLLDLWKQLRTQNNLNTQIPTSFQTFDPFAFVQKFREKQEKKQPAKKPKSNQATLEEQKEVNDLEALLLDESQRSEECKEVRRPPNDLSQLSERQDDEDEASSEEAQIEEAKVSEQAGKISKSLPDEVEINILES